MPAATTQEGYTLLQQIGEGTYGKVYSGRCSRSSMTVAIKCMKAFDDISELETYRFLNKRSILFLSHSLFHACFCQLLFTQFFFKACLSNHLHLDRPHPYVLQLLDEVHINSKTNTSDLWLIFEYGLMDLCQFVHERHLTNVQSEALQELCAQMADGLNHFHSLGLLHRDLKPANILIFMDSNLKLFCKIADLGMVKASQSSTEMTPGVVAVFALISFSLTCFGCTTVQTWFERLFFFFMVYL